MIKSDKSLNSKFPDSTSWPPRQAWLPSSSVQRSRHGSPLAKMPLVWTSRSPTFLDLKKCWKPETSKNGSKRWKSQIHWFKEMVSSTAPVLQFSRPSPSSPRVLFRRLPPTHLSAHLWSTHQQAEGLRAHSFEIDRFWWFVRLFEHFLSTFWRTQTDPEGQKFFWKVKDLQYFKNDHFQRWSSRAVFFKDFLAPKIFTFRSILGVFCTF